MIRIEHKTAKHLKAKLDVLFVLAVEGEEIDDELGEAAPAIVTAVKEGDFTGKRRQRPVFYCDKGPVQRIALIGAGPRKGLGLERVRRAAAAIVEIMRELKAKRAGVVFHHLLQEGEEGFDEGEAGQAIAEAVTLMAYRFQRHKTVADRSKPGMRTPDKTATKLPLLQVFTAGRKAKAAVERGAILARASNECRAIGNEPGNVATPKVVAETAKGLGKEYGFKVKVFGEAQMKKEGMGALLCVSQGSREEAQFIIMEHKPKKKPKGKLEKICLVGKGLTFDAGGISIKPADKMWEMKFDKMGGCAVIGAMCAVAALDLPLHVYGIVPASENLPDGAAVKPGDIVTALTGRTIEVLNTDAEGRLILADALGYCHRLKPDVVVDFATLTGACVVALATIRAGVMGDDGICQELKEAGDRTGERVWQLPLDKEYGDLLKSENADLKNIGGRWGGAITAGYFLSHFAPPKARWAHIDIAGPAWKTDNSGGKDYLGRGATGFGVRLILDFLRSRSGA